jgi:hypothetical protein
MHGHIDCPACAGAVEFDRFHAGFGDQGFMYGSTAPTVLIWSSFDRAYRRLVPDQHPWMLSADERAEVEEAIRSDLPGAPYAFDNPPLCPHCGTRLAELFDESRAYFVVVGDRVDAERGDVWSEPPPEAGG